jgi:hypothetical protein
MAFLETLSWWSVVTSVPLLLVLAAIEWSEGKRWRVGLGIVAALLIVSRLLFEGQ